MWYRSIIAYLILMALCDACTRHVLLSGDAHKTAYDPDGMVVTAHPLATQAGVEILESGGNAVDAAIAIALTLAVVYPRAGNIGGGGFMMYRPVSGPPEALDFREKAPIGARRDMYLDTAGTVIPGLSTDGALSAGVPGTIAGLHAAHVRFGSLPWKRLFAFAIRAARDGHSLNSIEAARLNTFRNTFIQHNGAAIPFVCDSIWHEGDILRQPDLAKTLERIANEGWQEFYSGETARALVKTMQTHHGLITVEDLKSYRAVWRTPIITGYHGYRVILMPPPSSAGVAIGQLLAMVAHYPIHEWGPHDLRTVHLMAEAERRVFADRSKYLGDPEYYNVPVKALLDSSYLATRMEDFDPLHATKSDSIHPGQPNVNFEPHETTHFTVVDRFGNAVCVTTTLNTNYGSKVYVGGAGFFLNNEMDDFSMKPGEPNSYGLIGAEANAIAPGKRMLSSMAPTILEKDGKFFMTAGTPGGSTIITSVFQVILDVVDFGMSGSDAVATRKFHHQWLPDEIRYEDGCFSPEQIDSLRLMGYTLKEVDGIGAVEIIRALPNGRYEGAADLREADDAEAPD